MTHKGMTSYNLSFPMMMVVFLLLPQTIWSQGEGSANSDLSSFIDPSSSGAQVDKHTGAFSFSMPLMTVPGAAGEGYPIVLAYSPPSPDAPATWVGHGWTLGPGAITRSPNGIPDDFNNVSIINIDKRPVYEKLSLSAVVGVEVLSGISLGATPGITIDNQRGILPSVGLSFNGFGAGISYMQEGGDGVFNLSFNPMATFNGLRSLGNKSPSNPSSPEESAQGAASSQIAGENEKQSFAQQAVDKIKRKAMSKVHHKLSWGPQVFAIPTYSNSMLETRFSGEFSLQGTPAPNIGPEVGIRAGLDRVYYAPIAEVEAVGYMHSGEVDPGSTETTMKAMDFFEERPHTLDEYDRFIPLPVQTPDMFSVSAGNLGGQFRCFFSEPGSFHPRGVEFQSEFAFNFGTELGAGSTPPAFIVNLVGGATTTKTWDLTSEVDLRSWACTDGSKEYTFPTSRNRKFFAFKGDPGLEKILLEDDVLTRGVPDNNWKKLDGATYFGKDATKNRKLQLSNSIKDNVSSNWRPRLNKSIRWTTAAEMDMKAGTSIWKMVPFRQLDKADYSGFIDYNTVASESITEFEIIGEDGMRYTFGLPVYTRNQLNLAFSVDGSTGVQDDKVIFCDGPDVSKILPGDTEDMEAGLSGFDVVQGKLIKEPVATMWLLTSITSPDYVDIGEDGCTDDDLGTWVRFEYERDFGSYDKTSTHTSDKWFRFRDPVAGNRYQEGSLGDARDDMGSFSLGEKEVYRLKRIETRTHYAVIHEDGRQDGRSIANFNDASTSMTGGQWASDRKQRIQSIELFAKNQSSGSDELLQSVEFTHDYSSWPASYAHGGLTPQTSSGQNQGKLTLTKVEVKSMGVEEDAQTYQFNYNYFDKSIITDSDLHDKYEEELDETAGLNESPTYDFNTTDAWGTHKDWNDDYWARYHGWRRINAGQSGSADPAAYCLKQITMPTGLRILPQYERNEYRHVQDKLAHVMVPLSHYDPNSPRLYLDTEYLTNPEIPTGTAPPGLGWEGTTGDLADLLKAQLSGKRVFTKLLFKLPGLSATDPTAHEGGWNYFPTFVKVADVGVDGGDIYIEMAQTGNYSLPKQACWDFCQKNPRVAFEGAVQSIGDSENQLLSQITEAIENAAEVAAQFNNVGITGCSNVNVSESYVRIPLLNGAHKVGGGLRVKRLMVYDPGITTSTGQEGELLTGTEYTYQTWNDNLEKWVSSGVAANEPRGSYEECTLYRPLAKEGQSLGNRLLGGKDTETQAGPVGESFLPPPSVGYEEVTTRSIHDDASGEGETVHRFFSHRSHPVGIDWTNPSKSQLDIQKPNNITSLINILVLKGLWYSQGLRVITNDMAGKPSETISYSAERNRDGVRVPVSRTSYEYFEPGESIATLDGWETGSRTFGSFDEVYFMGKFFRNHKVTLKMEWDLNVSVTALGIAVPIPSAWPSGSVLTEVQGTHATVMQSHRPSKIKSITSEQSGMETIVENVLYNRATAQPLLTSTTDGYSDLVFDADGAGTASESESFDSRKLDLTASALPWHTEFGKASRNDQLDLTPGQGLLNSVESIYLGHKRHASTLGNTKDVFWLEFCPKPGKDLCGVLGQGGLFYEGDLYEILYNGTYLTFWYASSVDGNRVYIDGSEKLGSNYYLDVEGIRILESGRSNRLATSTGTITAYDDELDVQLSPKTIAASFREDLVDALNDARPHVPVTANPVTTSVDLSSGSWSDVAIEETGCTLMSDPSAGLGTFWMQFDGASDCGTGTVSFPNPPGISTTPGGSITVWTPGGGSTGNPNGGNGDPIGNTGTTSPNGRAIEIDGEVEIPIHYAPTSEGGPGEFQFDEELGAIVWVSPDAPCSPTVIFTPCEDFSQDVEIANVLAASATSYSDQIDKPLAISPVYPSYAPDPEAFEYGARGRWSPEQQFTFSSTASSFLDDDGATTHSTQVGFLEDFTMLSPYHADYANDHWINSSTTEAMDKAGRVIESSDAYGYTTAMRFNHIENTPIWSAAGGSVRNCLFESFENIEPTGSTYTLTDSDTPRLNIRGVRVDDLDLAHSGRHSWRFGVGSANQCVRMNLPEITLDDKAHEQGIRVRFWAHEPVNADGKKYSMDDIFLVGLHTSSVSSNVCTSPSTLDLEVEADSIAQTGKWVLIDAVFTQEDFDGAGIPVGSAVYPVIQCDRSGAGSVNKKVYIDDVRIQPTQAAMSCSVFDPVDFRLLTEFDGNHFGTFHQYNHKGQLIRQQVETEAGLKTVSETQSHTPQN